MIKPRPLRPGACVRLVAPASPFDPARLADGVRVLTDLGLAPIWTERVLQREGYLAGPDGLRALELAAALTDGTADAVVAIRGGYGVMRLLDVLEPRRDDLKPALVMGFSDLTALHLFLAAGAPRVTFHGPNVLGMARLDADSRARLGAALSGTDWEATFAWGGLRTVRGGAARGRLLAGNLSMLCAMMGTRYAAALDGTILVVEDVHEPAYRIDRLLTQLALHPDAPRLAGVVLGDLGVVPDEQPLLDAAVAAFAARLACPVVAGFPAGHGASNHPIPLNVPASLDADVGLLRVLEDPFDRGDAHG
jgi:muramoyltetrapeptide carboxypeptidase